MNQLNPYAKFLDARPVEAILADSPSALALLLTELGPARSNTPPAPGKWSPAEVICHLADCELVFAFRLRQTLAEEGHVIQPFDQEKWAVHYPGTDAGEALALFIALRNWNLKLIHKALPASANRTVTHPERGTMTFQTIVETMAGHDLNHIAQLKRLAGKA
jgi:hypothetical protein